MSNAQKNHPHLLSIIVLAMLLIAVALSGCGADAPEMQSAFAPLSADAPKSETVAVSTGSTLRLVRVEGQSLTEVWVDDVHNFYALDMEIQFDPAQLQVNDANSSQEGVQIRPGNVPAPDFVAENIADNQKGVIRYVLTQVAPREGFTGSGLVATITWQDGFNSKANIAFGPVTLVNQDGQPIEIAIAQRK